MKKLSVKTLALAGSAALLMVGCNSWKDMAQDYYTVTPDPLVVKGGQVSFDINGQFPAQVFNRKAALELTPNLMYANGTTAFESVVYQGEKYPGNYTVIPYAEGKSVSYSNSTAYNPDMAQSELVVNVVGLKGNKMKELGAIKIADGVIATETMVKNDFKAVVAPTNFVRDTQASQSALIHFLVNSSYVRPAQLKNAGYLALLEFVKQSVKDTNLVINSVDFIGHASPEGEATLNENLSIDRAKAVEAYAKKEIKKYKIAGENAASFYSEKGEGADWDGFFDLLANSNMTDKAMIKRTLDGEPLLATKEATLKSLESTYAEIRDQILPELRRTEIKVNYTIIGKTDAQILALAKNDPSKLTANELMHAATLTQNADEQLAFYKSMVSLFPNDYRGYNNEAILLWVKGDKAAAKALFEKAYNVEANAVTKNNIGVVKADENANGAALELFKASDTPEATYNQGVLAIKAGNYAQAVAMTKGYDTFNAALAQVLNGNPKAAISTLDKMDCDCASMLYLKAIAYARDGQNSKAKATLAELAQKDAAMAAKAQKDLEFRNL